MAKTTYKSFSIGDFSGGLNTAVAESNMDTKYSPDLYNVDFTETGGITRRNGCSKLADFPYTDADVATAAVITTATSTATPNVKYTFTGGNVLATISGFSVYIVAASSLDYLAFTLYGENSGDASYIGTMYSSNFAGVAATIGVNRFTLPQPITVGASQQVWVMVSYGDPSPDQGFSIKYGAATTTGTTVVANSITGTAMNGNAFVSLYGLGQAKPVNALYRYYQTDGDRYWLAVHDGNLHAMSQTAISALDRVEAESVVVAASSNGEIDTVNRSIISGLSAGLGWQLWALGYQAKFTVPSCTQMTIGLFADGASVTGSYKVDSGSWVNATLSTGANAFTVTGLADTTHTVYVKSTTPTAGNDIFVDYFDYGSLGTWANKGGTLSASTDTFGISTLNNVCYITSPYDPVQKYDGTTLSAVSGTPPKGSFLIEHKRRLWCAGDYSDPSRLFYTEVDLPEDWAGGGEIRLAGKDAGGNCTGLIPWQGKILYFSESQIWSVDPTGADTGWTADMSGYNRLSWSLGCIAPKSLVQTDQALVFLSADGIRAFGYIPNLYTTDGSGLLDLSRNIRPTLDTITDAMKAKAAGAFYNGKYYLSVALDGASVNNAVLVYDLEKAAWTKYTGMSISCWHVTRGDEYGLYAGDAANGKIYRFDYGTNDDGAAISMYYKTPQISPGGAESVKHFRHLHLAAESTTPQSLTVGVNTDDVAAADQSVSTTSNTAAQPLRVEASSRGRSVQYELTSSGAAQPLTVSRLTTVYHQERVR